MTKESMRVHVGQTFEVSLEGNPTTGFRWEMQLPSAAAALVAFENENFEANTSQVGAPAVQRFRFSALAPGRVNLVFKYRRAWEKVEARDERVVSVRIE